MSNPYYQYILDYPRVLEVAGQHRYELIKKYSFAIPSTEVLKYISEQTSKIIELGAGSGYWSRMLDIYGIDVVAFDNYCENYGFTQKWFDVQEGSVEQLKKYSDRSLLLCWPSYETSFAYNCLKNYTGREIFYIGEGSGGCTGNSLFHEKLENSFELKEIVSLPNYSGIYDKLFHFKK